jgi:hypothetical protein
MLVSRLFPENASSPMFWTLAGISMARSLALENALFEISTKAEFEAKVTCSNREVFSA